MRITVIPDTHGTDLWKKAKDTEFDLVISLGDIVDSWDEDDDTIMRNLEEQLEWLDEVGAVKLLGNHDMAYLMRGTEFASDVACSGYRPNIADKITRIYQNTAGFKIAHQHKDWLFTHAGLSQIAYDLYYKRHHERIGGDYANLLNTLFEEKNSDVFAKIGTSRGGWDPVGCPTWADKSETMKSMMEVNQVIGHSRVKEITKVKRGDYINIYTDCTCTRIFTLEI